MGFFNFWKKLTRNTTLEELVKKITSIEEDVKSLKEKGDKITVFFSPGKDLQVTINGETFKCTDTSKEMYEKIAELYKKKDAEGIKNLIIDDILNDKMKTIEERAENRKTEIEQVKKVYNTVNNVKVLLDSGDFEVEGNSVFLKGIKRSLPKKLVDKFSSLLPLDDSETTKEYEGWKNFWYWMVTNPNVKATESFYDLMNKYNVQCTKEGFILGYRWVAVKAEGPNKKFIEFVCNEWKKLKKWKKSPKNFYVAELELDSFKLFKNEEKPDAEWTIHGNLQDLYDRRNELQDTIYTDCYTRKMDIKIGQEVKMDRKDCDESGESCSRGLHNCFKLSDHSGNGDVKMLTAICPRDIVSVPYSTSKFRSCKYMPLAVLTNEQDENFILDGEGLDILEGYSIEKLDQLKKEAEENTVAESVANDLLPKYFISNEAEGALESVITNLSERMVNVQ